jgi:hypothetical protein
MHRSVRRRFPKVSLLAERRCCRSTAKPSTKGGKTTPPSLKGIATGRGRQKLTRTTNNSRHQPFAALSLVGIGQSSQWLFESHHNFEGARGFTFLLGRLRCQSQAPLARANMFFKWNVPDSTSFQESDFDHRLDRWSNSDSARGNDAPDPGAVHSRKRHEVPEFDSRPCPI